MINSNQQRSFECCGMTSMGYHRQANEDQFLISEVAKSMQVLQTSLPLDHQTRLFGETQGMLLLVADGMGGHAAGERASQLVIDGVVQYVLNRLTWLVNEDLVDGHAFEEDLKRALIGCQQRIAQDVVHNPQRRGMGSTLTLAYIVWPRAFVVHVGDSRCYLLRSGELRQLTRDHTIAHLMKQAEDPTDPAIHDSASQEQEEPEDESPETAPMAHMLWNVVAAEASELRPDAFCIQLDEGDLLLLCTDGLYQHVRRSQLSALLESKGSAAEICDALIQAALLGGGTDNITAIVSKCGSRVSHSLPQTVEIGLPNLGPNPQSNRPDPSCEAAIPK